MIFFSLDKKKEPEQAATSPQLCLWKMFALWKTSSTDIFPSAAIKPK